MNKGLFIFGIALMSISAFMAGVKYEQIIASKTNTEDWNISKTGSMNIGNAVVGAWLNHDGKVVVFKQPINGDGSIWVLHDGPIELSTGSGTSIIVNKITK